MRGNLGIIDYGCGNIHSICNAMNKLNIKTEVVSDPLRIQNFNTIILPGVGAFDTAIRNIDQRGFRQPILQYTRQVDTKLVGICLGMQILCEASEESTEQYTGLGLFETKTKHLIPVGDLRLPNMGWLEVEFTQDNLKNFDGDFYFVHSYAVPYDQGFTFAKSTYGNQLFSAGIFDKQRNIFGFQFHPEKSHDLGLKLLSAVL